MAERFRFVAMCYLATMVVLIYTGAAAIALTKIQRQLLRPSCGMTAAAATPAQGRPLWHYLVAVGSTPYVALIGEAVLRKWQRKIPGRCAHCGRSLHQQRRCFGCGVVAPRGPGKHVGFSVLPLRRNVGRLAPIATK